MVFHAFALNSLKELKLMAMGSYLNLRKLALHRRIVVLQSSLNQSLLCLFKAVVFAMVSFATEIRVSVTCFVRFLMFGSCNSFCL